jgi:hypothetical protein
MNINQHHYKDREAILNAPESHVGFLCNGIDDETPGFVEVWRLQNWYVCASRCQRRFEDATKKHRGARSALAACACSPMPDGVILAC